VVTDASPVKAGVGALPMSPPAVPETVVAPVLVIPDPARTAKLELLPKATAGSALESVEFRVKSVIAATIAIAGTPNLITAGNFLDVLFAISGPPGLQRPKIDLASSLRLFG
jgi:hypothetical protein